MYSRVLGTGSALPKRIVTNGEFAALLADYVVKPPGKPALVPLSDKRPEINSNESAKADFSNQ